MSLSIKLGRIAGIDLYLHSTFLLLLAFVGLMYGGLDAILSVIAVFGCVLLHEFGHALTAKAYGIGTEDITLYPIGGVARLQRMPRAPSAELLITLAGPAVNVAIATTLGLLLWISNAASLDSYGPVDEWGRQFVFNLLWINVFLAGFNMIPAFPMDGGRIFRALLSNWIGRLRATEIAAGVGRFLAFGFGLYSLVNFNPMHIALAVFLYYAGSQELARVRAEEWHRRSRQTVDEGTRGEPGMWIAPAGYQWVSRGHGIWQLAPIVVTSYPQQGAGPWR
jgi:Zn-dependent protease